MKAFAVSGRRKKYTFSYPRQCLHIFFEGTEAVPLTLYIIKSIGYPMTCYPPGDATKRHKEER